MIRAGGCWAGALLVGLLPLAVAADTLEPFSSDRQLEKYLVDISRQTRQPAALGGQIDEVVVTGARGPVSITNNQTAGVDEGGIVKLVGDYLVVLRRGRLFTVSLAGERMRAVAWMPAYPPNVEPDGAWYDEMLVHRDRIVVIGYSYAFQATEINLFRIDSAGGLRYEATWHLRASDYYSASNYASRLVDGKLVFYSALPVSGGLDSLPAMRRLPMFADLRITAHVEDEEEDAGFTRIVSPRNVFRPPWPFDGRGAALHTITSCDLDAAEFGCKAISAVGSYSEVFHVSNTAAYVWTALTPGRRAGGDGSAVESFVYRLPLDGGAPTALPAAGMPIDQFSFLEQEGWLNVMVAARGSGNWMWNSTSSKDSFALLRVPLSRFGDGRTRFDPAAYRDLPFASSEYATPHNRFVGQYLLYGAGDSWGEASGEKSPLFITRTDSKDVLELPLDHSVDRIEALGEDAVVIGTDRGDDLHFTGIRLEGSPAIRQHYRMQDVEQGELRSHGFFYRSEATQRGVFGLPVRSAGSSGGAHLRENSSGITYIHDDGRDFALLGVLETVQDTDAEDGCLASCVDWYGNARPIFIEDRVFALLGYELVEGAVSGQRLREIGRVSFAPFIAD